MADNVAITAGSGTTVAADDIGAGVLAQRVKVMHGADGSGTDSSYAAPLPVTRSPIVAAGTQQTRLANATTYALGDIFADNATAGSITVFTFSIARASNQPGRVLAAKMEKSSTTIALANFRLHLFNVLPVPVNGDNGVFSTPRAGWLGFIDLNLTQAFSDGAAGMGAPPLGVDIPFAPVSGAATLYGLLETRAAYVPTSAETYNVTLFGE